MVPQGYTEVWERFELFDLTLASVENFADLNRYGHQARNKFFAAISSLPQEYTDAEPS